jgi:hypothetical protein
MAKIGICLKGQRNEPLYISEDGFSFGSGKRNHLVIKGDNIPEYLGQIILHPIIKAYQIENFTDQPLIFLDDRPITKSAHLYSNQTIRIADVELDVFDDTEAAQLLRQFDLTPERLEAIAQENNPANRSHRRPAHVERASRKNKSNSPKRVAVSCMLFLILGGLAGAAYWQRSRLYEFIYPEHNLAPASNSLTYVQKEGLGLMYQRIRGNADVTIRYSIEIDEEDKLIARIFNLSSNRLFEREAQLTKEEAKELSARIVEAGFLEAPSESATLSSSQDEFTIMNIILKQYGFYHEARVFNELMPLSVKNAVQILEGEAVAKLNIEQLWSMPFSRLINYVNVNGDDASDQLSIDSMDRLNETLYQLKDAEKTLAATEEDALKHAVAKACILAKERLAGCSKLATY